MKAKEFLRFIKFSLFSISAGIIQFGSYELLSWIFFDNSKYGVSYIISISLSVVWNFTFNFKYTFKAATNIPKSMALAFLFYVFFIPPTAIGGDYLVNNCNWNDTVVLLITMVLNFILEFLWNRFVIYGKKVDTRIDKCKTLENNKEKE